MVVLALVVAVASSSHGKGPGSNPGVLRNPVAVKRAPSDPEKDEYAAVKSVLAYTPFVREGGTHGRDVALTFDDGPGPYTPEVLSVLERMHVQATFFAIGKMLRYFGTSTVREIEDGDVIGDHTESHPELAHLSRSRPVRRALRTDRPRRTPRRAPPGPLPPSLRLVQRHHHAPARASCTC